MLMVMVFIKVLYLKKECRTMVNAFIYMKVKRIDILSTHFHNSWHYIFKVRLNTSPPYWFSHQLIQASLLINSTFLHFYSICPNFYKFTIRTLHSCTRNNLKALFLWVKVPLLQYFNEHWMWEKMKPHNKP